MQPQAFDKRACLSRAESLLDKNDDDIFRYICLELRFCLEAIAYDKLRTYAKRLPETVLSTWQPPQVIRALLEFEPLANQDFVIRFSPESDVGVPTGEWVTLGTHRTLRLSWLRKNYNKLGNYLHVPTPVAGASNKPKGALRQELQEIVSKLKPVVESSIDSSLAAVLEFECSVCHMPSFANIDGLKGRKNAVCLNPNCQAEFFAEFDDHGEARLSLISSTFECFSCAKPIIVENRKLEIGVEFSCPACGTQHQIASKQWGYGRVDE